MIDQVNNIAQSWWDWMWPMFWQASLLIVLIAAIDVLIRRWAWPQLRHALWLLVLVKLVLPPSLSLSTSFSSRLYPIAEPVLTQRTESTPTVAAGPLPESSLPAAPLADAAAPLAARAAMAPETVVKKTTASAADRAATAGSALSWQVCAMAVWLLGVLALSGYLALRLRHLRVRARVNEDDRSLPPWLAQLLADTAARLKLRRLPGVWVSESIASPAVFGVFKPVLLIPAGSINSLSRQEAEHVLLHELTHIKRGDLLVHTAYMLLQIIYWFNPLLWFVRRQLQHLRELCCDAAVARVLRDQTPAYRETLLQAARRLLAMRVEPGLGLLGLFEDTNRLLARLKWLEKKTWQHRKLRTATVLAAVAFMLVCVLPMARAKSAKQDREPAEKAPAAKSPSAATGKDGPSKTSGDSGSPRELELDNLMPEGWTLDYDSGLRADGSRWWRSGMAENLATLLAVPRPADSGDMSWKQETYKFDVRSLGGKGMGSILITRDRGSKELILAPESYLVWYRRERGKPRDNFRMICGPFPIELAQPGMYQLKFRPKLGTASITGKLGGCYALNFEKVGTGQSLRGFVYQHEAEQYVLDGLPAGDYHLAAIMQKESDNVWVNHAKVTVQGNETATVDMRPLPVGHCSLKGRIIGKHTKPRARGRSAFKWYVLIRKPNSPVVETADVYEALTMDTMYVVRGRNIVEESEDAAKYSITNLLPGDYTITVIAHDLWAGARITRQQSKPLTLKVNEQAVLDFDLRAVTSINEHETQAKSGETHKLPDNSGNIDNKTGVNIGVATGNKRSRRIETPVRRDFVPIIARDVKLHFADPIVRDGSFHSDHSVAFALGLFYIKGLPEAVGPGDMMIVGQTTWPLRLQGDRVIISNGSTGREIGSEPWPAKVLNFDKVITLPVKYGDREYRCPVHVELTRRDAEPPIGSYWFCAYLSGRLPSGVGGRAFEIVNVDQQMEFRDARADFHGDPIGDAALGIDINGDGKIDPAKDGGERLGLYDPFRIKSRTYQVIEVDPYLPRVVFREVTIEQPGRMITDVKIEKDNTTRPAASIRMYDVERDVSQFLDKEDFSTPKAAYATINRLSSSGDPAIWERVSVKKLAERFSRMKKQAAKIDPEWADVLQHARILKVWIGNGTYAVVAAELPQEFSSKIIRKPIDVRHLELEDGRWLNKGNDRVDTLGQARELFDKACELERKKMR